VVHSDIDEPSRKKRC